MQLTRRTLLAVATPFAVAGCLGDDAADADGEADGSTPEDTETETSPTPAATETDSTTTPAETETETAVPTDAAATVQVRSHPEYGDILVGPEGLTLYMFDRDTNGEGTSACYDSCADAWPPLTVTDEPTKGEEVTARLGTFDREDGETQVTAGGWPLYYFASDAEPGDAKGQGVSDVWWVLATDGSPVRPELTPTDTPTATPTDTPTATPTPTPTDTPTDEDDDDDSGYY